MFKLTIFCLLLTSHLSYSQATSEELREKYPAITEHSTRKENKKILCPFHRMIERAGLYDKNQSLLVSIKNIISATKEFGCKSSGCGLISGIASLGQLSDKEERSKGFAKVGMVNIARLHMAKGLAHDCGLTFAKGGTEVSNKVRNSTLNRLKEISSGNVSLENLMSVKKEICASQNVEMDKTGEIEVKLIYAYLGGNDRGFVDYEDVVRFLNAEMPLVKAEKYLGFDSI